jgi:hypothetical protein
MMNDEKLANALLLSFESTFLFVEFYHSKKSKIFWPVLLLCLHQLKCLSAEVGLQEFVRFYPASPKTCTT